MKEYIKDLITIAKDTNSKMINDDNYDLAFLKELVEKVNNSTDYFYEFILDLNSDLLKDIIAKIEPASSSESFLASTIYLKNLISINKEQDAKIPLSDNQISILYQLLELIKKIIDTHESRSFEIEKKKKKNNKKYDELEKKIDDNLKLDTYDYDLVEELVENFEKGNIGKKMNEVMTYLNSYNYDLYNPEDANTKTMELPIMKKADKPKTVFEVYNKEDIEDDIFNPKSFDYFEVKKPSFKENKNEKSVDFNRAKLLSNLGLKEEDLSSYNSKLLSEIENFENVKPTFNYVNLIKNKYIINNNSLLSIILLSDKGTIESLFSKFKELSLSEESINELLNRAPQVFFTKNVDNFINNIKLALSYDVILDDLIKQNITFFYNSFEDNKNKISALTQCGINVGLLFKLKSQLFAISTDKLIKNINILKCYGVSIKEEDYDSLSIIAVSKLNLMLDTFIEVGFSMYISYGIKDIRALILKRIFYAYKNNLSVWNENITKDRINEDYDKYIEKELISLTEEDIRFLISDYPILEMLEEAKRPVLFGDVASAHIERKYQFRFGNIIISRIKTYSVFKILISHNINEKEALFYALTYNSNLDHSDYMMIKKEILRK